MNVLLRLVCALSFALITVPPAFATCGSAFCTINTNWDSHGAWAEPGLRLDLRYERITQDQPRAGRSRVAIGELPRAHDEVRTLNRNWLASLDYSLNADWGVGVALPVAGRDHFHLENDFANGTRTPESWKFTEMGDARVLARYRIAAFEDPEPRLATVGINFGLKLPTGRIDVRNADADLAERTLQPGTGSTDALLGAYYAQLLPAQDLSWFVQGMLQAPLDTRDGFRPGRRLSLDAGLRYDATESFSVMLQLNALFRGRDAGASAEPQDSGGRSWFLSPGASYALAQDIRAYAFLQAPLYQYVNGVQLTARRAAVIGISIRF